MVWKVAIIGGGPGGLGAAVALSQLNIQGKTSITDWTLFEKKQRISKTGGGISVQQHTWRMLELLGVADLIDARDLFRPKDGCSSEHRNAVTGAVGMAPHSKRIATAPGQLSHPAVKAATSTTFKPRRIADCDQQETGQGRGCDWWYAAHLSDGQVSTYDLVIGADGIRSVTRLAMAPGHKITYNGQSAYLTILHKSDVASINGIPDAPIFWHYVGGKYVFSWRRRL
ncbi:hypothetical protein SEPCBS57363_006665 [Sporothrix epigloea]|uniref:FAD-binding domain-containing protein n=1 Tax=Sporothrix epigloea TaxID=1892477 RepID=A0ABP0E4R8_9PEZI